MEQTYVLGWLDETVNKLDPERETRIDKQGLASITEQAAFEKNQVIAFLKQIVFRQIKKRRLAEVIDNHFTAVDRLIRIAESYLVAVSVGTPHVRSTLEALLLCLSEIWAFIVERYRILLDPDTQIHGIRRLMPNVEFPDSRFEIMLADTPALSVILSEEYISIFGKERYKLATLRKASFWQAFTKSLPNCGCSDESNEPFLNIEIILIQHNFNAPAFAKYITEKLLVMVDLANTEAEAVRHLSYLRKSFNQISVMKGQIYDIHYEDLRRTVDSWFAHEIEYRSRLTNMTAEGKAEVAKSGSYSKKNAEKILCMLTVDQLALLLKAADQAKIISARSLSAIFKSVAPYLSTPHKEEISQESLRTKSYSIEERDKEMVLATIEKLAREIEDL